jgi:FkbM family methyltransferase
MGYLLATREVHLQRAIREYVKRGDTVYDIGANIGYVSLSLSKQVGPSGRVVAFEPLPENLALLRQAIAASGIENVSVLEIAASDARGTCTIRTAGNPSMASLVWHQQDAGARSYEIATDRVDALVEGGRIPPPTFVKVDVEGAEGHVIRGMERTIARSKPVLFVECTEIGREATWKCLTALGYRCLEAVTKRPARDFGEYRHSDYIWLPPG